MIGPWPGSPVEPSSDIRQAALTFRGLYLALVAVGFTEEQALTLVRDAIAAGAGKGGQ